MSVSVLIPCRNPGLHIVAAVRSAKAQPETSEILVADAGCTDGSIDTARELGAAIIELGDVGQAAARNALATRAQHPWVQWLDADDYLLPGKLAAQLAVDAPCSYCDFEIVLSEPMASSRPDARQRRLVGEYSPLSWARLGAPLQIACYLTATEIAQTVPFDPEFDTGGNNAKWALDLTVAGANFTHVPVIGCVWRQGWSDSQTTADKAAAAAGFDRFAQAVRSFGLESPASPIASPKLEAK